jgi:hypothetical protein
VCAAIQVAIPYVSGVNDAFQATPLYAFDSGLVAAVALTPALIAEAYRAVSHRPWVA